MLNQILEKLGVKDYSELKDQERQTYLQWSDILNKPDLTIEDLKKFLPRELERANEELRHWENTDKKEMYFKAYTRLLKMLTDFLTAPEKERAALEAQLKKQFNI